MRILLLVAMLSLAAWGQATDSSPEAFARSYIEAWVRGDFQTTYSLLSQDLKKQITLEQHTKSLSYAVSTPEGKARLAGYELDRVESRQDPKKKVVYLRFKEGSQMSLIVVNEGGHWKLFGP